MMRSRKTLRSILRFMFVAALVVGGDVWVANAAQSPYAAIPPSAAIPPYDSVQQRVIDGIIDDGEILIKEGVSDPVPYIREQLKYTLGQLNWEDAAPKLSSFEIEVGQTESDDPEGGWNRVHYRARGHISWSRKEEVPSEMELVLPARGDSKGLNQFIDHYFRKCTNDPLAERRGYFFFFYPHLKTCPMSRSDDAQLKREEGRVVRFPMRFEKNSANSHDKYPEYGRIWADHKLTVTAIFGKYEPGRTDDGDQGIQAYNRFYLLMLNKYGRPTSMSHSVSGVPGARYPKLKMVWKHGDDSVELYLALVSAVSKVGDSFISWYQKRTLESDAVIYSGHAGYGENIDGLVKYAAFEPNRYQIFFINGCDTFTYLNEELFSAHAVANPDAPGAKYLDIITNSVSNHFDQMADASFALVEELVRKEKTYRDILKKIDPKQRAVVDGEEDNTWPEPFRDWSRS